MSVTNTKVSLSEVPSDQLLDIQNQILAHLNLSVVKQSYSSGDPRDSEVHFCLVPKDREIKETVSYFGEEILVRKKSKSYLMNHLMKLLNKKPTDLLLDVVGILGVLAVFIGLCKGICWDCF